MIALNLTDPAKDFLVFKQKAINGNTTEMVKLIAKARNQDEYIKTYCQILMNLEIPSRFMLSVYKELEKTAYYKKNIQIKNSPFRIIPTCGAEAIHKLFAQYFLYKTNVELRKNQQYSTIATKKEDTDTYVRKAKVCQDKINYIQNFINSFQNVDPRRLPEKRSGLIASYNQLSQEQTAGTLDKLKTLQSEIRIYLLQVADGKLLVIDSNLSDQIRRMSRQVQHQKEENTSNLSL